MSLSLKLLRNWWAGPLGLRPHAPGQDKDHSTTASSERRSMPDHEKSSGACFQSTARIVCRSWSSSTKSYSRFACCEYGSSTVTKPRQSCTWLDAQAMRRRLRGAHNVCFETAGPGSAAGSREPSEPDANTGSQLGATTEVETEEHSARGELERSAHAHRFPRKTKSVPATKPVLRF